jgi:hypothetical protein
MPLRKFQFQETVVDDQKYVQPTQFKPLSNPHDAIPHLLHGYGSMRRPDMNTCHASTEVALGKEGRIFRPELDDGCQVAKTSPARNKCVKENLHGRWTKRKYEPKKNKPVNALPRHKNRMQVPACHDLFDELP